MDKPDFNWNEEMDRLLASYEQSIQELLPRLPERVRQRIAQAARRPHQYTLVGQSPVPCEDLLEWARWLEGDPGKRIVARTYVGPFMISTVFLGLDHNFGLSGPPVLFETMTFLEAPGTGLEDYEGHNCMDGRACTWLEAEQMHRRAVEHVRKNHAEPGDPVREVTPEEFSREWEQAVQQQRDADGGKPAGAEEPLPPTEDCGGEPD